MKVIDEIYGEEEINEKVLIELVNCNALQRLKGISQMGMPQEYYHKPVFSRYDHSTGVLILLKKLNADLKEQIAGLLHDVSHTAFSHVVDWIIGDPTKEDYQDNVFSDFIKNSEIPFILNKYGFNYKDFSNLENFSLLEKPAPSLCVDRFDYSIKEINWKNNGGFIERIVDALKNHNGNLVFSSKRAAKYFAEGYAACQIEHWASNEAKARYYILSKILKKAISNKVISIENLGELEDEHIINLLKKTNDRDILYGLNLLRNGFRVEETDSDDGIVLKKKFRYVDPEILLNGGVVKLSEISQDYRKNLERLKQESKLEDKILILEKIN